MTKQHEIYKCTLCGNVVEVTDAMGGTLVCCGLNMNVQVEKIADPAGEKHVPLLEYIAGGTRVKVGSVDHPMTDGHYIQWIEIINGSYVQRKYLTPDEKPYADFYVPFSEKLIARAFCNLHGLWVSSK